MKCLRRADQPAVGKKRDFSHDVILRTVIGRQTFTLPSIPFL